MPDLLEVTVPADGRANKNCATDTIENVIPAHPTTRKAWRGLLLPANFYPSYL